MKRPNTLPTYLRSWLRGFQNIPYAPMIWALRDVAHVPTTVIAKYCDTNQASISATLGRACRDRTSKRYRKHLDAALGEFAVEISKRLKLLRAEEDDQLPNPDRLPPDVYHATVNYLEALHDYVKAIGEWRDR